MKRDINKDLELLAQAFFKNLEISNAEFGGIGLDGKRPFGNSDVEGDILDIIGWKYKEEVSDEQYEYARKLYNDELIPYLQTMFIKKESTKDPIVAKKAFNRDMDKISAFESLKTKR